MDIHFGFSYIGFIFLLMLMIPNIIWNKNQPKNYGKYVKNENKVLLIFERIGEMLVTCISLIFSDFNINKISNWTIILLIAFILMILYEIYWIRYFKSNKTMKDMYSSLLKIPVAGATLPVVAFLLLGIYGKNIFLIISTIILGIGHIGIHLNHKKELE
ncbi:MAG: hypothetical protein HFJ60_04280 [Clostridia bacterium]|jgi:hypothetical protein|nr:hypothetical protein [Clostridia bacterium]